MKYTRFFWDAADDPDGNVQHVAEHDLTVDDVAAVSSAPVSQGNSNSSGLPAVWGYVPGGRFVIVIFEEIDEDSVYVVTAYPVPEQQTKRKKKKEEIKWRRRLPNIFIAKAVCPRKKRHTTANFGARFKKNFRHWNRLQTRRS
jgi:hypothetical protein